MSATGINMEYGWGIRENFIYKNEMLNDLSAWLRSFKAPRKDAVRVACVGNSITYGAGIKNRSHDSYPSVLGRLLGDKYWVKNFGVRLVHDSCAAPGNNLPHWQEELSCHRHCRR